jgi:hypothetical protein
VSWRVLGRALTSPLARPLLGLVGPLARHLSNAGWSHYREGESYTLEDGIELMEAAWALRKDPGTACRLGVMYERANRNADRTVLYREAFRRFPDHAELRYQAAVHVLRHGELRDIQGFLDRLRSVDPGDAFLGFTSRMIEAYERFIDEVGRKVQSAPAAHPKALMCFAVWGDGYVRDFMTYACASLLAPGNLPRAAERWSIQLLVFTSSGGEAAMRSDPLFDRVARWATVHFLHFPTGVLEEARAMPARYGQALGGLYARACKFQLFSASHYAALEAGRRQNLPVMPLAADCVFGDQTLFRTLSLMEGPIDVVNVLGFRLARDQVLAEAEARFRRPDGVLEIPAASHAELVARHMPREYLADAEHFSSFPLMVCWRTAEGGIVVHTTHYHPLCVRAGTLQGPLDFTIDPVDSRFLSRHLPDPSRIHLVTDMEISLSDWGDVPSFGAEASGPMVPTKVSLFLWMYWDELRDRYLRTPIMVGAADIPADSWSATEQRAEPVIREILDEARRREAANRARRN